MRYLPKLIFTGLQRHFQKSRGVDFREIQVVHYFQEPSNIKQQNDLVYKLKVGIVDDTFPHPGQGPGDGSYEESCRNRIPTGSVCVSEYWW